MMGVEWSYWTIQNKSLVLQYLESRWSIYFIQSLTSEALSLVLLITLKIFQIAQILIVDFVEECRYSFDQTKNKFV